MAQGMDSQVLMTTMMGVAEQVLSKMAGVSPTEQPKANESDIVEFMGRMKVMNIADFNAPVYIASVNFYLNQADLEKHKAKGAMVIHVDVESASKLYRGLGFKVPDDEDDMSMLGATGELGNLIGDAFKNELAGMGHVNLVMSAPRYFRNSIQEGVEYSPDQKKKYEFNFFYWKKRVLTIEVSMAAIPQK